MGRTWQLYRGRNINYQFYMSDHRIGHIALIDEEGYVTHVSQGAADADTMYDAYKDALELE